MTRSSSIRLLKSGPVGGDSLPAAAAAQLAGASGYFYRLQLGEETKESSVFFPKKKLR